MAIAPSRSTSTSSITRSWPAPATGYTRALPLEPRTVADFYEAMRALLDELGVDVRIWPQPVEIPDPIPFAADTQHRSYDRDAARRFFEVLRRADMALKQYRGRFSGKSSPVHFFWGSFDLAVTRFSGRPAPPRPRRRPHHAAVVQRGGHERRLLARRRRRRRRLLRLRGARAARLRRGAHRARRRRSTTRR